MLVLLPRISEAAGKKRFRAYIKRLKRSFERMYVVSFFLFSFLRQHMKIFISLLVFCRWSELVKAYHSRYSTSVCVHVAWHLPGHPNNVEWHLCGKRLAGKNPDWRGLFVSTHEICSVLVIRLSIFPTKYCSCFWSSRDSALPNCRSKKQNRPSLLIPHVWRP